MSRVWRNEEEYGYIFTYMWLLHALGLLNLLSWNKSMKMLHTLTIHHWSFQWIAKGTVKPYSRYAWRILLLVKPPAGKYQSSLEQAWWNLKRKQVSLNWEKQVKNLEEINKRTFHCKTSCIIKETFTELRPLSKTSSSYRCSWEGKR